MSNWLTFPQFIDRRAGRLRADIEQDTDYAGNELDARLPRDTGSPGN